MSEEDWNLSGEEPPKKKRRIPRWVLFGCGGGCLLATILAVVVGIFMFRTIKDAANPEKQWPALAEVLPFDERPQQLELQMGMSIPFLMDMQQFVLRDPKQHLQAQVQSFSIAEEEFDQLFSPDQSGSPMGLGLPEETEAGEMELQGRTIKLLRFASIKGVPEADLGPGVRLDLRGGGESILVDLRRFGSKDALTEEEIRAFFEPFDVWRGR